MSEEGNFADERALTEAFRTGSVLSSQVWGKVEGNSRLSGRHEAFLLSMGLDY